jgi:DivIVA domain-containing protein
VFTLLVIVALAVVAAVSLLVVGSEGRMADVDPDREPVDLPEDRMLAARDLDRVRFALGFRGYRMDQVDGVLDRAAADLDAWSEHVDGLEALLREQGIDAPPRPMPTAPSPEFGGPADDDVADDAADDAGDAEEGVGMTLTSEVAGAAEPSGDIAETGPR